jgi:hypothetical protein
MKHFSFVPMGEIPEAYLKDCNRIRRCLSNCRDIDISLQDSYHLWKAYSQDFGIIWNVLPISDSELLGMLDGCLVRFGYIVNYRE